MNQKKLSPHNRMQKKLIFCIFALIFSFQALSGAEKFGFKLAKSAKYTQSTQVLLYQHQKSGAQVVWFKNDNKHRAFSIAFRTRAYDDVGLPHIFEHACLAGSNKYPSSNLFFQMTSQTYNTYMNAATAKLFTFYPCSSLSEEQLFANLDVYMNGVYDPIVLTEENDLKREAVRFVLNSPDEEISATGAVYNELIGVFSDKNTVNRYYLEKFLFPNSTESYITGGVPADIRNVSWQAVKDFHKKYYKPSNCVVFLYGKLDINRFLEYFDRDFFSKYEKESVDLSDTYLPWKGFREGFCEFPVTADTNTENSSIISYVMTAPGADEYNGNDFRVIDNYFSQESSWISQTLKEKFPLAKFRFSFNSICQYPRCVFEFQNVNEKDKDQLMAILKEAINRLCSEKIDQKYIEIFANGLKMSTIIDEENPNPIDEVTMAGFVWSSDNEPLGFLKRHDAIMKLPKTSTPETVLATARKFLLEPEQSGLFITKPVAGLAEKKAAEEAKYFADKKAAMTKAQIEDLIQENKAFESWLSENEKINLIDKVKVITKENLPEEATDVSIIDKAEDGQRFLLGENKGLQYVTAELRFDLFALPKDFLYPAMLYFALLGNLETKNLSLEELEFFQLSTVYSSSFVTQFMNIPARRQNGGSVANAVAGFTCLNEKLSDSFSFLEEVLLNTELKDYDAIRSYAGRLAKSRRQGFANNPISIVRELAFTAAYPAYTSRYYTNRLEYWDFLDKVSAMDDSEIKKLTEEMEEAKEILLNRNNLTFICIADKKQMTKCLKAEKALAAKLSDGKVEKGDIFTEHKPFPKKIAVIVPGNSCYNCKSIPAEKLSAKYNAKYEVLTSILSEDYLFPTLRFKLGSYGAGANIGEDTFLMYTYRDPGLKTSYEVFNNSSKAFAGLEITEEKLDGYLSQLYSSLAEEESLTSQLETKIYSHLIDYVEDNKTLRLMKELKSVRPEDKEEFVRYIQLLEKEGSMITVGGAEQIYANKDMFDLIITDFIK